MKKTFEKFTCIVFIVVLSVIFSSCPIRTGNYVALGDSVAAGYGLSPEDRYTDILYNIIKEEENIVEYINLAVTGYTTTMLLELLNNLRGEELRIISNAKIITLNIGGNNILGPFKNYLSDMQSQIVSGRENIKSGAMDVITGSAGILSKVISRIEDIIENPERILDIGDYGSEIGELKTGADNFMSGTREIISGYQGIFSTIDGSFSDELRKELENGVKIFSQEFNSIITLIKKMAPKATIVVNTVYNPIPQEVLRSSVEFSNAADKFIESINNIIVSQSKSRKYLVSDVYPHFTNQINMTNFNLNPYVGNMSLDIVHPNAVGQNLIAQLNYETLKKK